MSNKISTLSNLSQRIIVGVLGGAVFIGGIWFSEWTYFLLFLALTLLGVAEFYRLVATQGIKPNRTLGLVLSGLLFVSVFLVIKELIPATLLYLSLPVLFLSLILEMYRKKPQPFTNISFTLLGVVYVAGPFGLLHLLGYLRGAYSWQPILGVLFLIWAADTGAYIFGKSFGKHKLFERISPGKTWEGWAGGTVVTLLVAYVLALFFTDLVLYQWIGIGLIVAIFGVLGDLVESLLKRSLGVKDSGTLLPGHGGILDRFDSLLMVIPFIVAFLKVI
ncbi:phosphatidate cytidylyltransferase [Pontibacter harenae]|uniref:phosphatidate cytidylyltransferase n=1 Tax=Pontibacter harenae TaxID=2894083 RepID=UPI001E5FB7B9|nr:phosphatidate cytidylyltransferase [Pontibacter harenae]MCC9165266.1 phosphatidate cytidylyltransferase [Pontibacter harenae]